ncbi:MAG: nucleotidyl transferase AbiEii/AbiGii toxin family protein [Candidatus Kuenenbacteria bacterium]
MLNQYLIEKLTLDLKIAPLNIIREYLEMEVLYYLSQSKLAENIIFYGGTALRLAYYSFRFSEDLDFLLIKDLKSNKKILEETLKFVAKENKGVTVEEVVNKRQTLFGLLHIKNELLKHSIRIKIEISKKKNGLQVKNILLSSPVSIKEIIFKTASIESIYKLKQKAIQNRNMPRDWFDYWYLSQKLNKNIIINKNFHLIRKNFLEN